MVSNSPTPEQLSLERRRFPEDIRDCADHLVCAHWRRQDEALALRTWELENRPLSPREQTLALAAALQIYREFQRQQLPQPAASSWPAADHESILTFAEALPPPLA